MKVIMGWMLITCSLLLIAADVLGQIEYSDATLEQIFRHQVEGSSEFWDQWLPSVLSKEPIYTVCLSDNACYKKRVVGDGTSLIALEPSQGGKPGYYHLVWQLTPELNGARRQVHLVINNQDDEKHKISWTEEIPPKHSKTKPSNTFKETNVDQLSDASFMEVAETATGYEDQLKKLFSSRIALVEKLREGRQMSKAELTKVFLPGSKLVEKFSQSEAKRWSPFIKSSTMKGLSMDHFMADREQHEVELEATRSEVEFGTADEEVELGTPSSKDVFEGLDDEAEFEVSSEMEFGEDSDEAEPEIMSNEDEFESADNEAEMEGLSDNEEMEASEDDMEHGQYEDSIMVAEAEMVEARGPMMEDKDAVVADYQIDFNKRIFGFDPGCFVDCIVKCQDPAKIIEGFFQGPYKLARKCVSNCLGMCQTPLENVIELSSLNLPSFSSNGKLLGNIGIELCLSASNG